MRQSPAQLFGAASRIPLGKKLFSQAVAFVAPYFRTISPTFLQLEAGRCEVAMKDRRAVHNHIGTVHAIAMCNLCELAAGTMLESTLPRSQRWIPRGMTVRYLKKAETDLVARTEIAPVPADFAGDLVVPVKVFDTKDDVVMEADITMYISSART